MLERTDGFTQCSRALLTAPAGVDDPRPALGRVVDRADRVGHETEAFAVEEREREELRARRDAFDVIALARGLIVVLGGDDAGHVRAVLGEVAGEGTGIDEVVATVARREQTAGELRVIEVHAGVDDGDGHTFAADAVAPEHVGADVDGAPVVGGGRDLAVDPGGAAVRFHDVVGFGEFDLGFVLGEEAVDELGVALGADDLGVAVEKLGDVAVGRHAGVARITGVFELTVGAELVAAPGEAHAQ